jgi:hypothetical protein
VDRFPPIPRMLPPFGEAYGVGTIYEFDASGALRAIPNFRVNISDVDLPSTRSRAPRDTVPSCATLFFKWQGVPQVPGNDVVGYKYKLEEPDFTTVSPSVTSVTYNSGVGRDTICPTPGLKIFTLRTVDVAGGTRDSTRRFIMNFSPDTWWSGPDLASAAFQTKPNGEKYVVLDINGRLPAPITGSWLSQDSINVLPALRPERRTFFEIWRDTVFARSEFDTVHLNSWVILHNGGFDKDSEYRVRVSDLARNLPGFPGGRVLRDSAANGSPVGFRSVVNTFLTPEGPLTRSTLSGVYPLFDPNDVFNKPVIGGYHGLIQSGKAYALARAEDGDGARDGRIVDVRDIAERYPRCQDDPSGLRCKILVFYINRAPYFRTDDPSFFPTPSTVFTSPNWNLFLPAHDIDPYEPGSRVGGPTGQVNLRYRITIRGRDLEGDPLVYTDRILYANQPNITFTVPPELAPGPVTLEAELCDCLDCELFAGTGRCITLSIPVIYQPSASPAASTQR